MAGLDQRRVIYGGHQTLISSCSQWSGVIYGCPTPSSNLQAENLQSLWTPIIIYCHSNGATTWIYFNANWSSYLESMVIFWNILYHKSTAKKQLKKTHQRSTLHLYLCGLEQFILEAEAWLHFPTKCNTMQLDAHQIQKQSFALSLWLVEFGKRTVGSVAADCQCGERLRAKREDGCVGHWSPAKEEIVWPVTDRSPHTILPLHRGEMPCLVLN